MTGPDTTSAVVTEAEAAPATSTPDEDVVRERLRQAHKRFAGGTVGALVMVGFGAITVDDLRNLEAGRVEVVRIWRPAALLYRAFGLTGAVVAWGAMVALMAAVALDGLKERSNLTALAGKDTVARLERTLGDGPRPRELWLFGIMVALGAGAAVYVWMQVR